MITASLAKFTIWLHFRINRFTMRGQQRGNVKADAVKKFEQLFDTAWPEDYNAWIKYR